MDLPRSPVRRVWVDSGPAGTPDPAERIMVFVAEGGYYAGGPVRFLQGRTTISMSETVRIPLPPPPLYGKSYMDGFEGSDLVAVYYALDELGRVNEGESIEVVGDGQVLGYLRGEGKVSAKYAGRNWAPDIVARIREAESDFPHVVYRTIASSQNRAGHVAKRLKGRNQFDDSSIWYAGGSPP